MEKGKGICRREEKREKERGEREKARERKESAIGKTNSVCVALTIEFILGALVIERCRCRKVY